MQLQFDRVSPAVLISLSALCVSISFEVGYFDTIGVEFITFISPQSVFVFFAFSFPVLIFSWWIFQISVKKLVDMGLNIKGFFEIIPVFGRFFKFILSLIVKSFSIKPPILGFLMFWLIFLVLLSPLYISSIFFGPIGPAKIIQYSLVIWGVFFFTAVIIYEEKEGSGAEASSIFILVVNCCLLSYIYGQDYARYFAGAPCSVVGSEKVDRVTFLRAVDGGILVKEDAGASYIPNSKINKITCRIETTKDTELVEGDLRDHHP